MDCSSWLGILSWKAAKLFFIFFLFLQSWDVTCLWGICGNGKCVRRLLSHQDEKVEDSAKEEIIHRSNDRLVFQIAQCSLVWSVREESVWIFRGLSEQCWREGCEYMISVHQAKVWDYSTMHFDSVQKLWISMWPICNISSKSPFFL